MPKRSSTLETVGICLDILHLIPRHYYITVTELHERLTQAGYTRDRRSIERHLKELCEKYGIECNDRTKPYGYKWMKDAKGAPLPMLSQQESLLLALAEEQLRNILPTNLMKSMESFFNQARYDLTFNEDSLKDREWLDKVRVIRETQPLIAAKIDPEVFEEVSSALYGNKILGIEYKNAQGKTSKNRVMPLGLAQQGASLYLVCRFEGFENERTLALHRLIAAKATLTDFIRPTEFNLEKYDDDGRFGFGAGRRIKLTFNINQQVGKHLLETKLAVDQTVHEFEDMFEISATVVETDQLEWWLRGFGDGVTNVSREYI